MPRVLLLADEVLDEQESETAGGHAGGRGAGGDVGGCGVRGDDGPHAAWRRFAARELRWQPDNEHEGQQQDDSRELHPECGDGDSDAHGDGNRDTDEHASPEYGDSDADKYASTTDGYSDANLDADSDGHSHSAGWR